MRLRKRTIAFWFLLLSGLYLWTFETQPAPHIQGDGYYTLLWAVSLAMDQDLDLANQYQVCGDPWRLRERRPADPGQWPHNTWSVGPSLVWAPILAVARLAVPEPESSDPRAKHGCAGTWPKAALHGTAAMGLLAVFFTFLLARRYAGDVPALAGAFGIALATPLFFYATMVPSYTHAPAAFGVALFLERWDATRGSRKLGRWILLGVLLGLAMLMRPQSALLVVAPLFEWIGRAREDWGDRRFRRLAWSVVTGVAFTACIVATFFPQLYIWKRTYGEWLAMPQGPLYMRWDHPHLDGVLFSSVSGLFTWSPILYAGAIGLILALFDFRARRIAATLLVVFVGYWYVNACVWDWWGSAGYGARRFVSTLPLFGFGIAIAVARFGRYVERRPARATGAVTAALLAVMAFFGFTIAWAAAAGQLANTGLAGGPARDERASYFWLGWAGPVAKNTHEVVGNPLAWPASIPFALLYDVHPRRYDMIRGMGGFYQEFESGRIRARYDFDHARIGRVPQFDYAVDGFEEETRAVSGKPSAVTSGQYARLLLPIFAEDLDEVEWSFIATTPKNAPPAPDTSRGSARVSIRWNGRWLAQEDVPARWSRVRIRMPRGIVEVGVNVVELQIENGPIAIETLRYYQDELPEDPDRMRDWRDLNQPRPPRQ